jgi:hypothetical protein
MASERALGGADKIARPNQSAESHHGERARRRRPLAQEICSPVTHECRRLGEAWLVVAWEDSELLRASVAASSDVAEAARRVFQPSARCSSAHKGPWL